MCDKLAHLLLLLSFVASHVSAQGYFPTVHQRDDLFSATHKLEGLAGQEEEIVRMLQSYISDTRQKLDDIQQYIAAYQNVVSMHDAPIVNYVSNPIDAYLLMKRLTVDWGQVEAALLAQGNLTHTVLNTVMGLRIHSQLPVDDDLHGAAVALVRLQDTYKLNMTDLVHGLIRGTSDETKLFYSRNMLGPRDCLFLARHAYEKGYYDTALDWGQAAIELAENETDQDLTMQIVNFNDMAIRVHDEVLEKRGPLGPDWQTRPVPANPELKSNVPPRYDALAKAAFVPKLYQFQNDEEEAEHYERLCRGEKLRPLAMESELKCFTSTRNNHPYLVLQPIKIEEKSRDPYIVVIHDLLRDESINVLKSLAGPKLMTSKHKGPQGQFVSSMIRTSKNAWIQEADHPSLTKIRKRMEFITGLHMQNYTAAEEFQVANYGIGGLYVTHLDNVINDPDPAKNDPYNLRVGDRIATLMVYLTDVEAGGATVFPRAGVTTWPVKGAAAFWWNLYRNGQADDNSRHGACPVLHGSKWVSNKWVRAFEQMFVAPCGLYKLDKYTLI